MSRAYLSLPFICLALTALLGGCALNSSTRAVDDRPGIAFKEVPVGAVLYVDKIQMGDPSLYDGKHKVLRVEAGTHDVEVKGPNGVMLSERIFCGSGETRTITLTGAGENTK